MEALDAHDDLVPLAFEACWALRNVAGMDDTRALVAQGEEDTLLRSHKPVSYAHTNPSLLLLSGGSLWGN
jgi:hypothetical protein